MDQVKSCSRCKESLPLECFSTDNSRKDKKAIRCKSCCKPYAQLHNFLRKDKAKVYQQEYHKNNPKRRLIQAARRRAARENLPIDITYEDIVVPEFCPILGLKLEPGKGKVCDTSPTIDKKIPALGYTKNNIRVISFKANRYKSDMTIENVERLLEYLKNE